jgi:hypothetical protein
MRLDQLRRLPTGTNESHRAGLGNSDRLFLVVILEGIVRG